MGRVESFKEWLLISKRGKEVLWWIIAALVGVVLAVGVVVVVRSLGIGGGV